ncbi:hypothetical protein [Baaleninema simplex]|uniref:hypothetical protein n=1 Tax=Baaleninema simplex TaxID=2862350 RepID=UPI0003463D1A|nr:hypothetical protein [Baaleninema simplex]
MSKSITFGIALATIAGMTIFSVPQVRSNPIDETYESPQEQLDSHHHGGGRHGGHRGGGGGNCPRW